MRRATAIPLTALAAIILAGCSTGPSQDEIVERFAIELASVMPGEPEKDDPEVQRIAASFAEDAPEHCNDAAYWDGFNSGGTGTDADDITKYVWAASCSVLYDIDEDLDAQYRQVVAERTIDTTG